MRYLAYILSLCLLPILSMGQVNGAHINITSGYMKIGAANNGTSTSKTYVVLDDSSSNALITSAGTGVLSGGEFNMLQWNIGKSTGSFTLPWVATDLTAVPLVINITSAGVNNVNGSNASIQFSTWHTDADQLNGQKSLTGMPSDCNNLSAMFAGEGAPTDANNSYNVVDRFWVIDDRTGTGKAYKAGAIPSMTVSFTYLGSSDALAEVSSPNVFTDGNLVAQRYNTTLGTWGDYTAPSSDVAGATSVLTTTGSVTAANFFRDWTLANRNAPLPIKLISFTALCQNSDAILQWSTASESNNDYFTIDKSADGVHFQTVAVVKGAGNSSSTLNYSTTDYSPLPGTSYYRISQTDFDGTTVVSSIIVFNHCDNGNTAINAFGTNNYIDVQINSIETTGTDYTISLCNTLGQNIFNETKPVSNGFNEFKIYPDVAEGIYFLTVSSATNVYHKKIVIKK